MSAPFSHFPESNTATQDEEEDVHISLKIAEFVQKTEEFDEISEYFWDIVQLELEFQLVSLPKSLREFLESPDRLDKLKREELQRSYTHAVEEVYRDLERDICLSALLLPIQIRDDLQEELLD